MKVVHVLKRIEILDQDIKDLKKLEKSLKRNKSFSTPIYMSIEKQINILLGDRIKLLELRIENPPENLTEEKAHTHLKAPEKKEGKSKAKPEPVTELLEEEIAMLTQTQIDEKFEEESKKAINNVKELKTEAPAEDESIKLLDIALEKGTLNTKEMSKGKDKKKVRFFKDNLPGSEY